jgi:CRP-like cAMP-binding protein
MESMYDILMELPLFQGVSRDKLSEIIEKTPFHFLKYNNGEEIVSSGDNCEHVRFVISGDVRISMAFTDKRVKVSEVVSAPNVLGQEYLFGLETDYPFSVSASGQCGIMQIEKSDYITILQSDKVFLFNMLNMLSSSIQKSIANTLSFSTGSIAERLAYLVLMLTRRGAKDVKVTFKQKDLCAVLGTQRSSLINALEKMKTDGTIDYSLSEISVKDRAELLEILNSKD